MVSILNNGRRFKMPQHSFIRYKCWQTTQKLQIQLNIFFSFPVTDTAPNQKPMWVHLLMQVKFILFNSTMHTSNGLCTRIEERDLVQNMAHAAKFNILDEHKTTKSFPFKCCSFFQFRMYKPIYICRRHNGLVKNELGFNEGASLLKY